MKTWKGTRYMSPVPPLTENTGSTWDYLCKLAAETGLVTETDESILSKQYELVDVKRDNVPLAQYLGDKTRLATYRMPKQVFYPFGCNASQKAAIEAALTHQVSIIQGPPGTGKTQTILNIIANLLMKGKTVLVVSNNNSAVENVAEKLEGEGLGFIVAQLGSVQNKEAFVANQADYPDMTDWKIEARTEIKDVAEESLQAVSQGFDGQLRQARLKAECDALSKEAKYNEMQANHPAGSKELNGMSSAKLMKLLNHYQMTIENGRKPGLWFRLKCAFSFGFKMWTQLRGKTSSVIAGWNRLTTFPGRQRLNRNWNRLLLNFSA